MDAQIEAAAERRYGSRMDEMRDELDKLRPGLAKERSDQKGERAAIMRENRDDLEQVRLDRDLFSAWSEHLLEWWRVNAQ